MFEERMNRNRNRSAETINQAIRRRLPAGGMQGRRDNSVRSRVAIAVGRKACRESIWKNRRTEGQVGMKCIILQYLDGANMHAKLLQYGKEIKLRSTYASGWGDSLCVWYARGIMSRIE